MHLATRTEQRTPLPPDGAAAATSASWRGTTKVAFRFVFVYFGLYNSELALHLLPFPPFLQLEPLYQTLRWKTVLWVAQHVLHLSHDFGSDFLVMANGSKDTTYAWVQIFCCVVIAIVATVIWSLADRKRREYVWLHKWLLIYLRVCLAAGLMTYGVSKLVPAQFPLPGPSALISSLGSFRRDRLLWISMGVSPIYSFFGGLMEVVPAFLLLAPRFVTLGALLAIATVTNIVMLNFGYNIGVKSLSTNMLLMGIVILLPDAARLTDFFIFNRSVPAARQTPLFQRVWLNRVTAALLITFGVVLFSYNLYRYRQVVSQVAAGQHTPLFGAWVVDDYQINGESRPPLTTNPHRWQRLIVNSSSDVTVQVMTGEFQGLWLKTDPQMHSLVLTQSGNPGWVAEFTYDNSQPGSLALKGTMGGLPVLMRLHFEDGSKLPLNDYTFNWVKDGPGQ